RAPERIPRRIEADHTNPRAVQRQATPRSAPDVERSPARAAHQPSAPLREPRALQHRAEPVVEPRDLLEAAHSGLRKDHEGARVVVEEVPPADRREFAVAEESHEWKLAETLADHAHVVVADAAESAT